MTRITAASVIHKYPEDTVRTAVQLVAVVLIAVLLLPIGGAACCAGMESPCTRKMAAEAGDHSCCNKAAVTKAACCSGDHSGKVATHVLPAATFTHSMPEQSALLWLPTVFDNAPSNAPAPCPEIEPQARLCTFLI